MAEDGASTVPARVAVHVKTLGCKVNRAESEAIATGLLACGARMVDESDATVVVINTCTVTGEADRKARKAVRHALAAASRPAVLVTGCLAALDAEGIEGLGDRVIVEADREQVARRVAALTGAGEPTAAAPVRAGEGFRARVAVKVEDGCDAFCTYCIVPHARGAPRSVPVETVLSEVRALAEAGTAEVVLTGINIGRYHSDGLRLSDLIALTAETGVRRIRLSSIEPLDLTPALLEAMARTPGFCPHVHVPLQSGSDRVLRAMGRGYTSADYLDRLASVRDFVPGVAITTDVMVGFPGETDEDFAETRRVVDAAGFTRLHVFRYSKRGRTPAASMPAQVPPDVSARRAALLRGDDAELRDAHAASRQGSVSEVLVEQLSAEAAGLVASGTTEDYLAARLNGDGLNVGDVVRVCIGPASAGVVSATRL